MSPRIYITVTITAVLVLAVTCGASSTTDSTAKVTTDLPSSNVQSSSTKVSPTTSTPTTTTTTKTTTTTPKPIICNKGSCQGNETCLNNTAFVKTTGSSTCGAGEKCVVKETNINTTLSNYTISCETQANCDTIEATGTGACCTSDCLSDLEKAKQKAGSGGGNGSDILKSNINIFIWVVVLLFKNMSIFI